MKTFMTTLILSATVLAVPASAMGIGFLNLPRNLTFPETVSEPVTQDQTKSGK